MIGSPALPPHHPDRSLACEEALEVGLSALAADAERAGWDSGEIDLALLNLALARLKAAEADFDVDDAIRRANRSVEGLD